MITTDLNARALDILPVLSVELTDAQRALASALNDRFDVWELSTALQPHGSGTGTRVWRRIWQNVGDEAAFLSFVAALCLEMPDDQEVIIDTLCENRGAASMIRAAWTDFKESVR